MIESIHLIGVATYGQTPSILDGLSTFNYLYGANGSGKTTISRVIADASKFPSCIVNWKARSPLETLVYNRDFIERHFRESDELPGIFTLGEKNAEAADKIVASKKQHDQITQEIVNLRKSLEGSDGISGKTSELGIVEDAFKEACWTQELLHVAKFKKAFDGFRNSKESFKAKVNTEIANNRAETKTLAYLIEKATTVFADDMVRAEPLLTINATALFASEKSPILTKKIIGKSDVDIAAMINRLGNSDWVRTGLAFLEVSDKDCPFCQQKVADGFTESLNAYFDESFEADSKAVSTLVTSYTVEAQAIADLIEKQIENPSPYLDVAMLTAKKKLFDAHIKINLQKLLEKKKEPSRSAELQSSDDLIGEITKIISDANKSIAEHNKTFANLTKERKSLKEQVWKFLFEEPLKNAVALYETKKSELEKAIANLKAQIKIKESAKNMKESEIRALERDVTSIQPTIDAINSLLVSFGFHGFSVAQADNKRCYKLLRSDGADAKETLSEGERTFVTFLYFYHLLKGSPSESGMSTDRVVVFDDPVSSLDSDILFIVSTLIRKLCDDVGSDSTRVKQVFLMTHNVYFHKEVTFQKQSKSGKPKSQTFWTVRKTKEQSQVAKHESNPIKSSYELLWLDVREARVGNLSIQNSLRRILETYFKMLGGIDLDKIHDRFLGNEKLACRALLSWVTLVFSR